MREHARRGGEEDGVGPRRSRREERAPRRLEDPVLSLSRALAKRPPEEAPALTQRGRGLYEALETTRGAHLRSLHSGLVVVLCTRGRGDEGLCAARGAHAERGAVRSPLHGARARTRYCGSELKAIWRSRRFFVCINHNSFTFRHVPSPHFLSCHSDAVHVPSSSRSLTPIPLSSNLMASAAAQSLAALSAARFATSASTAAASTAAPSPGCGLARQ